MKRDLAQRAHHAPPRMRWLISVVAAVGSLFWPLGLLLDLLGVLDVAAKYQNRHLDVFDFKCPCCGFSAPAKSPKRAPDWTSFPVGWYVAMSEKEPRVSIAVCSARCADMIEKNFRSGEDRFDRLVNVLHEEAKQGSKLH